MAGPLERSWLDSPDLDWNQTKKPPNSVEIGGFLISIVGQNDIAWLSSILCVEIGH